MNFDFKKIGALVLFGWVSAVTVHAERTWTNTDGEAIEATLVRIENEDVILRMYGRIYRVPIAGLSQSDQEFLDAWQAEQNAATVRSLNEGPGIVSDDQNSNSKKGYCLSMRSNPEWREMLRTLDVSWFYNWTASAEEGIPDGIDFVPMVTGNVAQVFHGLTRVKSRDGPLPYVLTHNEPDSPNQANRSVEEVLDEWPALMELGVPLVSPGTVNPENEWMTAFMEGIEERGYRVDYVAVHNYGGPNPRSFLRMLDRVHKKYDRPIWITEFGVGDWQAKDPSENRHSPDDVLRYMKVVLPELDKRDHIYRYSWFCATVDNAPLTSSALFDENGALTPLGQFYAEHK